MIKTFDELFDNPFNPKVEVAHINYIDVISESNTDIQPVFAENSQKSPENQEIKETFEKIDSESKHEESVSLTPVFTVKDITPRKSLFRRK